jgi:prepilin-type N-terminal cleavage/methylation domain-containing protein
MSAYEGGKWTAGRSEEAGFTLVELLCVIALLGMIISLAAPAMTAVGGSRNLELAARSMAMDMRRTQQRSITAGWTQRIEFRIYNNDYRIKDGKTGAVERISLPEGVSYRSVNFPTDGGYHVLSFNRSGAPNRGGTVALANASGELIYIIVTPATGRVRISESPPDNW